MVVLPQKMAAAVRTRQVSPQPKGVPSNPTTLAPPARVFTTPPAQALQGTSALLAPALRGTPDLPAKPLPAPAARISAAMEARAWRSPVAPLASVQKGTQVHPAKLTLTNAFPALASTEQCAGTGSVGTPATVCQGTKGGTVTWKWINVLQILA